MSPRDLFRKLAGPMVVSILVISASAQIGTFKILHTFTGGSDGRYPNTSLAFDRAGNLYGMTSQGGSSSGCSGNGCGNAFELSQRNGHWRLMVLSEFSSFGGFVNPIGSVAVDTKGNVYWTDLQGGDPSCNCGAVYQLTKNGGVWTQNLLHAFLGGSDGQNPISGLIWDKAGNLYGSTEGGPGTIFALTPNTDGSWTYNVIHEFGSAGDGGDPYGALTIDASGNLYGTTTGGGIYGYGMVFKLSASNGVWTEANLYNFTLDFGLYPQPEGVAVDSAGNLYGATIFGGEFGVGTIYQLTPTNVGYWNRTLLHTFTGDNDGGFPSGSLTTNKAGAVYGTTGLGGPHGFGTVFKLVPGKSGQWNEKVLHGFAGTDGSQPAFGVIMDQSGNLYGATNTGGAHGVGVAFEITP
jgi:uncharacterized repeat protein (TIGR03803 family)